METPAKGDNFLCPIIVNPIMAPWRDQCPVPQRVRQEKDRNGLRLFRDGSSTLVYYLTCIFSLTSNCFHGVSGGPSPKTFAGVCLPCRNLESKLRLTCSQRNCLPPSSHKNTQGYVCQSPDMKRFTFGFLEIFK